MKVILAVFELVIGLTFGSSVLVFFTSLAGISVFEGTIQGILYWTALGLGPLLLVVGPIFALIRPTGKLGGAFTLIGAAVLTCWAVYFVAVVPRAQPNKTLDTRLLLIALVVLAVALASDIAAYRIWRSGRSPATSTSGRPLPT